MPNDVYTIFDPQHTWKKIVLTNFTVKELHKTIFKDGNLVYTSPTLKDIAKHSNDDLNTFWDEIKRMNNPHKYFVDLSQKLWDLKHTLLSQND